MTPWKPIVHAGLRVAIERYRSEKGRDPREEHPDLDGDEGMSGVYVIMLGFSPGEEGKVVPFAADRKSNSGDSGE